MREIETLQTAVKQTRSDRPFPIDSWVAMPDRMHCVWTLPNGKAEYLVRWGAIKARVAKTVRKAGFVPPKCSPTVIKDKYALAAPSVHHYKGEIGTW